MTIELRIDLNVPYAEKEDAKALGARWDEGRKRWYAPPGTDVRHLKRWLPHDPGAPIVHGPTSGLDAEPRQGISLRELLARVKGLVERGLPEAFWVRVEISELRGKNGHLYPTLAERNERGDVLAQCKGVIWRNQAEAITTRFVEATGEGLKPDIKILCLGRVRFDPAFGFDLIIDDVDPSYTLGDLAAKLARIRKMLVEERLYDRNRGLPAPSEFVRVAVISPETSAGLGDFRRETDRLLDAGLCDFHFYPATFQGLDAPASIRTAVNEVLASHRRRPFDALAVIRGGGAVTDLAWLNDLELARLLCRSPIPVLTGIGHERDGTILDEVAHRRFDTPSKVALHIASTIRDNALAALADLDRVRAQVERIITRERTSLDTQVDRIASGSRSIRDRAASDQEQRHREIRTAAEYQLREASRAIETGQERVIAGAEDTLDEAVSGLARMSESVAQRTQLHLGIRRAEVERLAQAVTLNAQAAVQATARELAHLKAHSGREATRLVTKAAEGLECDYSALAEGVGFLIEAARREVEASTRLVVGLGPRATLRRGFAIARDDEGRPLTSQRAAARLPSFQVEFHDGRVAVIHRGREGGESP